MKSWLQGVADKLELIEIHSQEDNGKRMASALAVIVTLDSLIPGAIKLQNVEHKLMEILFCLLRPRPDCEKRTCHDLEFVFHLAPNEDRKTIYEALNSFCMELSHKKNLLCPSWLYVLPLLHFLRNPHLRPFHILHDDPKDVPWVDTSLGLGAVRSATRNKNLG